MIMRVTGVREFSRTVNRLTKGEHKARAIALKRVMMMARGRIRRAITSRLGIPLKLTRNKIQWYWKRQGGLARGPAEAKLWIGTAKPIFHKGEEVKWFRAVAEELLEPIARDMHRTEFVRHYKRQLHRLFARV